MNTQRRVTKIVNGDGLAWTEEQDDFLRQHIGIPTKDLASAVTSRYKIHRSPDSVRGRMRRLQAAASKTLGTQKRPILSLTIGDVSFIARLSNYRAVELLNRVKFDELRPAL